jgi:hypothetical protein
VYNHPKCCPIHLCVPEATLTAIPSTFPIFAASSIPSADIVLGCSSSRNGCTLRGSSERNASSSRKLYRAEAGVDVRDNIVEADELVEPSEAGISEGRRSKTYW